MFEAYKQQKINAPKLVKEINEMWEGEVWAIVNTELPNIIDVFSVVFDEDTMAGLHGLGLVTKFVEPKIAEDGTTALGVILHMEENLE